MRKRNLWISLAAAAVMTPAAGASAEEYSAKEIEMKLTEAAMERNIPPEIVKAVAYAESGWRQTVDGEPVVSEDGGLGLMQVTPGEAAVYDEERLLTDIDYNISAGLDILEEKYGWTGGLLPETGAQRTDLEAWYFPVMAYNGLVQVNSPIYSDSGETNLNAYQEGVFSTVNSMDSNLETGTFSVTLEDLDYTEEGVGLSVTADRLEPSFTTESAFFRGEGDAVKVSSGANIRGGPSTGFGTEDDVQGPFFTIEDPVVYDERENQHFLWHEVQPLGTEDRSVYIAASLLQPADVSPLPLSTASESFTDVENNAVIGRFAASDFVGGYNNGTFRPENNITRAEIATILTRMIDNLPEGTDHPFADVEDGIWFEEAVTTASASGLLQGQGNGIFAPNKEITRQEIAVLLYRLAELTGTELTEKNDQTMTDVDAEWAEESVDVLTRADVIAGVGNNKFDPESPATRSQVVTLLYNLFYKP
ncbi:S-layer homology domain-containing protein [Alkalicoccus urumqiensis]|nr:S-layer homology domain-containing protein [Alkalicoccus urumqiensis]